MEQLCVSDYVFVAFHQMQHCIQLASKFNVVGDLTKDSVARIVAVMNMLKGRFCSVFPASVVKLMGDGKNYTFKFLVILKGCSVIVSPTHKTRS